MESIKYQHIFSLNKYNQMTIQCVKLLYIPIGFYKSLHGYNLIRFVIPISNTRTRIVLRMR